MRGLQGKTIVIAGGGGGIGAATALRLGAEGANVIVGDYEANAAEAIAEQVIASGGKAASCGFDIRDRASVENLLDLSFRAAGKLDGVHVNVANMGILSRDEDVVSTEWSVFDDTLDVNLRGHVRITQMAIPRLLQSGGVFVFTSSETAYLSEPTRFSYAIAKSGVNTLMRHVAKRWGRQGIRANAVAPGFTLTPAIEAQISEELKAELLKNIHSPRHVSPEDIAATVAFLMSDDAFSINGQVINVDGGRISRA
jgi:NAD(P)-dependent dehydrogenase (short-subunit alcohol dehydrogenase family)